MSGSTRGSCPAEIPSKAEGAGGLFALWKTKFVRDTGFLWIGTLFVQGTYIVTSWLLARSLGPADYGRYELAFRFYYLCFFIANLGLINVTVVRYSQATGSRDPSARILALAAFLKIYLLMAVIIVVLGFFIGPLVGAAFYNDRTVGFYGWILCAMGFIDILRAFSLATLLGARSMGFVACFESAIALVRVLVLVLAIVGGYGLAGVIYGTLLATVISSLMGLRYYYLLRRDGGPDRPPSLLSVVRAIPGARMKDFFSLGFFIALNKNLMEIVFIFGTFYMAVAGWRPTGHLRIAWILMWSLTLLLGGIARNLLPTLGFRLGESGEEDLDRRGRTLLKVSLVSGVLFIAVTAVFLLLIPWVVEFLYGSEYRESISIIYILAVSHLVMGFGVVIDSFYIYAGRIKTCVKINFVLFALIIPCGYFAMKAYGAYGVAGYLTVARLLMVVHFVYIVLYFRKVRRRTQGAAAG